MAWNRLSFMCRGRFEHHTLDIPFRNTGQVGTLDIWAHEFLDKWAHWTSGHTDKWAHQLTGHTDKWAHRITRHMTLMFKYPPAPHCVRETVRDIV